MILTRSKMLRRKKTPCHGYTHGGSPLPPTTGRRQTRVFGPSVTHFQGLSLIPLFFGQLVKPSRRPLGAQSPQSLAWVPKRTASSTRCALLHGACQVHQLARFKVPLNFQPRVARSWLGRVRLQTMSILLQLFSTKPCHLLPACMSWSRAHAKCSLINPLLSIHVCLPVTFIPSHLRVNTINCQCPRPFLSSLPLHTSPRCDGYLQLGFETASAGQGASRDR